MNRLILALALFGMALGANAALLMRAGPGAAPALGTARVELGRIALAVPQALIREKVQMAGGRLDRLDLAVGIQTFEPLPQPSAEDPFRPMPERLTLILTASRGEPVAAELFHTVYARFLARETWTNPGGLVMRRFRQGTPYEDRELYLGVGGRKPFVALCPIDAHREMEPCLTRIRVGELDAELRFNARHLPEWRRILQEASLLVEGLPVTGG
ncbi:MAG: hypothetical protein O9308_16565 [Beijerinckiaceae bacterium]|nr:hypothetical protein [Beijerinckiaceae bacterium]